MRALGRLSLPIAVLQLVVLLLTAAPGYAQEQAPLHLKRSADTLSEATMEFTTNTAHYKPIFGAGDADAEVPKGVRHYGQLTVDPEGASQAVDFGREELVYYVLEGTGLLRYEDREVPISKDDFFYVPIDTEHGFSNPREDTLNVMVMGFPIPEDTRVNPTPELQIANARDVPSQVLEEGHGPTSSYQLLLGDTDSERDRLAAAYQVTSLYIIDFEPGGTNNEHRHGNAEEIYFMLQGTGEMVAGAPDGEPNRYPAEEGDTFFFTRDSPVGFFSNTQEGDPHARILAVRSLYPEEE